MLTTKIYKTATASSTCVEIINTWGVGTILPSSEIFDHN